MKAGERKKKMKAMKTKEMTLKKKKKKKKKTRRWKNYSHVSFSRSNKNHLTGRHGGTTEDLKKQYIENYKEREGIELDYDAIKKNPAARAGSKVS